MSVYGVPLTPEHRKAVLAALNLTPKLTADIVRDCRKRNLAGEKGVDLAREFGVTESAMSQALNGATWAWVE